MPLAFKPPMKTEDSLRIASSLVGEAIAVRDQLICRLRQDGASLRTIATLAGMTPQGVKLICDRARGGS